MSNKSSSHIGDITKLFIGSLIAQAIGVLILPILTRLYPPNSFGIASLFNSIVQIAISVVCLRYQFAIILPKNDEEASNLLALSLILVLVFGGFSGVIIYLARDLIAVTLLKSPELKNYLWLIPLVMFGNGIYLALRYWDTRQRRFGYLSLIRIASSGTNQITKLGLGYSGIVNAGGLIGGEIARALISASMLSYQVWKDDFHLLKRSIRVKKIIAVLKRYKNFPIFDTWSALINNLSIYLPLWLLAFFFSPNIVGFYALGILVLGFPVNLISEAVSQVFFESFAKAKHDGSLKREVEKVFKRLLSISIFPFLLLTFIGRDVFSIVFGHKWAEAGVYIQILALWMFIVFIFSTINTLFSILEKQGTRLCFNIALFILRATSLTLGGLMGNPRIALILYASIGFILSGWISLWILTKAELQKNKILYCLIMDLKRCSLVLILVILVKFAFKIESLYVLLIALFATSIYYFNLLREDKALAKSIRDYLSKIRISKLNEKIL